MTRVGFLYTKLRIEEKILLEELARRPNLEVVRIDDGENFFDIAQPPVEVDVVFERSVSHSRGLYIARILEAQGLRVVNPALLAERCGDKYVTSQILVNHGIPTPRVLMAFEDEAALRAIESLGYPCVLKPVVGSWDCHTTRYSSSSAS